MRGHTRVNRKLVCPPPEKINETLHQLWEEGHQEFVLSITRKLGISFTPLPSPPISPGPPTLAQRLRQRRPTPIPFDNQEEEKPRIHDSGTSVAGSLRRMLSVVIDNRASPPRSTSPSRSITPVPSDVPVTHPCNLPSVGVWDADRRKQLNAPPEPEELSGSDRGSMVPTLLIGSDGQTIREGSRAEAYFRAQAALEARMQQQRQQQQSPLRPLHPVDSSLPALSLLHVEDDDKGDDYYEGSGFLRVLRSVVASPAIVAIPVRPEDIPRVQETAARQGLYTSVLNVISRTSTPGSRTSPFVGSRPLIRRKSSLNSDEADLPIVVIGRDQAMTQRYVEMAQRGVMPGTIAMDQDMLSAPRLITTTQLIFIPLFTVIIAWSLFFFFLL